MYGLDQTQLPPPDAPHACPEIGGTAPVFSRAIYQALTQPSTSYHFAPSSTLAVAANWDGIYIGRFGEPLTLTKEIVPQSWYNLVDPHPSPDGERLYIQAINEDTRLAAPRAAGALFGEIIAIYERTGDSWHFVENVPYDISATGRPSVVFRGPVGDRIIFTGSTTIEEYERVGAVWERRGPVHAASELQIDMYSAMALTSDGLRAVYLGGNNMQMLYTDRENLDSWFRAPQPLAGVPKVMDAQLTDDCAHLYYSGLNAVFYSRQE